MSGSVRSLGADTRVRPYDRVTAVQPPRVTVSASLAGRPFQGRQPARYGFSRSLPGVFLVVVSVETLCR